MSEKDKKIEGLIKEMVASIFMEAGPNPFGYLSKTQKPPAKTWMDPEDQQTAAKMAQYRYQNKEQYPGYFKKPEEKPQQNTPVVQADKTNPGVVKDKRQKYENVVGEINNLLKNATLEQMQQIINILKTQ